jgi:TusA-related sulfurtransferase
MNKVETKLDVRGLSCPEPVIRTKKTLESLSAGKLVILADNRVAAENIRRLVTSAGWEFSLAEQTGEFVIQIEKGA